MRLHSAVLFALLCLTPATGAAEPPKPLRALFLGDRGHHEPAMRYRQLAPVLEKRGVELAYADGPAALRPETLARFDALVVYANIDTITPEQEAALLGFVEGGRGLVALHCASFCFRNSPQYVALVGAQFKEHGTGVFRVERTPAAAGSPVTEDCDAIESWDETYTHAAHNAAGRTVLETRGGEPWTWTRTQGTGRVFYTAWGHDERTWSHAGFQTLVERGLRWAAGDDLAKAATHRDRPATVGPRPDAPTPGTRAATIPFYPAGQKWGTLAEPIRTMPEPLPAAGSLAHAVHPAEFEVKPFVTEDVLKGKPLCLNWDERGRLWLALTRDYPNGLQPPGKGNDRLVIVEDRDGDGTGDTVTTFAEGLSVPTGFTFAGGGVVVLSAPDTLLLRDTDGDGRADERRVLFTGWGTTDTHAGPSNLQYNLDGWVYGMCGYAGFDGTVAGTRHRFGQGLWRMRPDGSALEFLRSTNNNSWGVGVSETGEVFGSTANGCPSVFLDIPNRYYERVRGWSAPVLPNIALENRYQPVTDKVRQVDWHGGFTAGAGHALYTARHYPPEYWNQAAFVCDPTGHLAATFVLQPAGAGYVARYGWNLYASRDEWSAPIAAEVGPDGCVWLIDWYNYIVQHNPTPVGYETGKGNAYETPLRDKSCGRVYRVTVKNKSAPKSPDLAKATTPELVAALRNDNLFWRRHAQRLLAERRDPASVPLLRELTRDQTVDAAGVSAAATHAVATLALLGDAGTVAAASLKHPAAGVRRQALAALPREAESFAAVRESGVLSDREPSVRLAALLWLSELPAGVGGVSDELAKLLSDEAVTGDRHLRDGLTAACAAHAEAALARFARGPLPGVPGREVLRLTARHHARATPAARLGDFLAAGADPATASLLVGELARSLPRGKVPVLSNESAALVVGLIDTAPAESRAGVLQAAAAWRLPGVGERVRELGRALLATVNDAARPDGERVGAARTLASLLGDDPAAARELCAALSAKASPALRDGLLAALTTVTTPEAGPALVERLPALPPDARAAAARVLLGRAAWTPALLGALEAGTLSPGELAPDQRQALAGHPDAALAARARAALARGGTLPSADRQKVIDALWPLVKAGGDPTAGKAAFVKNCSACHRHGDLGQSVGPELTGMAVHPREELLVHVLDPNRSVENNFRVTTVVLEDDRVVTGLVASESRTAVELVDAQGKRVAVPREDIAELRASDRSLMPEGFEKQLSEAELRDLLAFLTKPGKYVPLPLDKAATASSARGMFYAADEELETLRLKDWGPLTAGGVPFAPIDPQGGRRANVVLLHGPQGYLPPKMPRVVSVPCALTVKRLHILGGVSGWGFPSAQDKSVSLTIRLVYADGATEDHPLVNGVHLADYIRRVDVPASTFAVKCVGGQQLRTLSVEPRRRERLARVELVKGADDTAPIVAALTAELPE